MAALLRLAIVHLQQNTKFVISKRGEHSQSTQKLRCNVVQVLNTRAAPAGLFDRVSGMLQSIRDYNARRKVYRTTLAELRALNGRELADLGINKGMIRSIAYEAAYGT